MLRITLHSHKWIKTLHKNKIFLSTLSELASKHRKVDVLRKERERLKNTPTGILRELTSKGFLHGNDEQKVDKMLEENLWKFIPLLDLKELGRVSYPKDFNTDFQPQKFFVSKERVGHLSEFIRKKTHHDENNGFVVTGPNGVGKSELMLCWVSMCFAADRPVLYVPAARYWVTASGLQDGMFSNDAAATFLLKKFVDLNVDLIADEKLNFDDEDEELKSLVEYTIQNPSKKEIENAIKIQPDLFNFISKHKGMLLIDEHNALFKPVKITRKKKYVTPITEEYFNNFTTWLDVAGQAFPVYCGSSHYDFISTMGQGFEDKIVRVTPFTNEELGLLIGTHKAQADKIVIRKKISHNELNELPLAIPFSSIQMRKSETEKTIEAIHLLFSKECGGVVRLARNIISKLKNLKREIDIVDIKNAVYAETDNITTMGVIRARKIRNELNDEQKKEFDRFVRDVVLSSKKTFSTKFYDVVDNGLTYIINNDYHLVHQAAYRVFLKLYSYNELPTIDLVDPNNKLIAASLFEQSCKYVEGKFRFQGIPLSNPNVLLQFSYDIYKSGEISQSRGVYTLPKDIVQKDRVPQCFALIPDFPMFPIIDWIIFHQEGKQNPILFFKQATISNVQDHMKRGSDKFGELNAFFEKRNWHYDLNQLECGKLYKLNENGVSMAEALGRLILQDPTFVCVLNDEETSNTEVTQVENETSNEQGDVELSNGNKDKRDELRSQGLGVWSYSSKYPNLQVYFCYITARSKEEHANMLNENSSRIHNVLLTCKEHLPVILQEKIDKKSQ